MHSFKPVSRWLRRNKKGELLARSGKPLVKDYSKAKVRTAPTPPPRTVPAFEATLPHYIKAALK